MKLISAVDFVLLEDRLKEDSDTAIFKVINYSNFLKQPLQLGFFIPCDENNVAYESYLSYSKNHNTICKPYEGLFEIYANSKCAGWKYLDPERTIYYHSVSYEIAKEKYRQAKERVLFEGFELIKELENVWTFKHKEIEFNIFKDSTIEELQQNFLEPLELSQSAQKLIL